MKTRNYLTSLGTVLLFAMMAVMPSCTKDDGTVSLTGSVSLKIVNSAEGTLAQDYYSDGTKVNTSAVAYTQSSGYLTTSAGNHTTEFRTSGSTTATASTAVTFESGKLYTAYLGGSASSSSIVTTTDDNTTPPAGKARVRFIHLSSAAAASIDLGINATSRLVTGLVYKTASAYNDIDANTAFSVYATGSATAALTIPATIGIQAGKIYNIVISGSTAATITYTVIVQN